MNESEYMSLNCEDEFVFCFCTFCKQEIYAAPVTLAELIELSRAKKVIESVTSALYDSSESIQIGAQIAAKKILDSAYGIVERRDEGDEIWYDFKRLLRPVGEDGKRKKVYTTILSKKLIRVV